MVEVRAIDPDALRRRNRLRRALSQRAPRLRRQKTPKPALYLQVGAYAARANAERAAGGARAHLGDVRIVTAQVNGRIVQRVRLGPLTDVDEADRLTPKVRAAGASGEPRVAIDD